MFNPVPPEVIAELCAKLPAFKQGYEDDGLHLHEYEEFGPVELFRSSFVKSWQRVLDLVGARRAELAGSKTAAA